jgi:putative glutamine amidotransferase
MFFEKFAGFGWIAYVRHGIPEPCLIYRVVDNKGASTVKRLTYTNVQEQQEFLPVANPEKCMLLFKIMNSQVSRPVIGIPTNSHQVSGHPFQGVGEKYITAVTCAVDGFPVMLPAMAEPLSPGEILPRVDGILLTGSWSNVEPHHYDGAASAEGTLHDPQRDATTLPLIRATVDEGIPLLGICRGFQEVNVAFGGSLYQAVHEVDGHLDHREPEDEDLDVQYDFAHPVQLKPGGKLAAILGGASKIEVNSLHAQGVERLGKGLVAEARAPDGLVEAFSVEGAAGFAIAVQWHPEWRVLENPLSMALFKAFGDACRSYSEKRKC